MAVDLTPNLYAVWHLNESSGIQASDSSGNARHGTLINMEDGDWISGKLNNCLTFDGVNEYVDCGNIANFEKNQTFSVETWIKTTDNSHMIISRHNGTRGWFLYIDNTGQLYFNLSNNYGANNLYRKSVTSIIDGGWHHIIFTYDGSATEAGLKCYVDGSLNNGVSLNSLTATILVGVTCKIAAWTMGLYNKGQLDEIVIYDKELSQEEVTFRYNGGSGRETFVDVPPDVPSNPNPANGASDIAYNQDLDWDGNGLTYDIYFGTSSPPPLIASDVSDSDYELPDLNSCTLYYWKIVAKNDVGETSSPIWSFTTGNEPPIIPHTPSPANGVTNQDLSIILSWECADYNPNDTIVYDVYFGTVSPPPLKKSNHPNKNYTVNGLINDKYYYWKIVAKDDAICGTNDTASPIWSFKTKEEVSGGYEVFDPRKDIRTKISVTHKIYNDYKECIKIEDNKYNNMYIPIYLGEEEAKNCPTLPYIKLDLLGIRAIPHDINAAIRQHIALISIDIVFNSMDNINIDTFGKKVADKIVDLTRYYQSITDGIMFYNVINQGRLIYEDRCEETIYHWIMEIEAIYYDNC